jgi:GNAT superfamily N-acetyltransferase
MFTIAVAETDADTDRCFPVMVQLRPHLTREEFPARVRRQRELAGYQLVFLEDAGAVRAAAGFRVSECLAWGKFLYVDDLVTAECDRSKGYGSDLFDWLVARAKSLGCDRLELDSGVQRFAAHRFYLQKRMDITSHHFAMRLKT